MENGFGGHSKHVSDAPPRHRGKTLAVAVADGRFREDLLARIDLWTFRLPSLAERREDIEPNLDWELERWATRTGKRLSFNKEARERFLAWALAPTTPWAGNFREFNLNSSVEGGCFWQGESGGGHSVMGRRSWRPSESGWRGRPASHLRNAAIRMRDQVRSKPN